ncbi:2-isopropylmalate synthase [Clostridia bacterium]|nr:2-isopropylmalate synthase [Clostridia bacterium]
MNKYQKNYFLPPNPQYRWVKKDHIDHAPQWCSVDLRDGNQALINPMSFDEKMRFWKLLTEIGFKEIEVGFPAASATEFEFCRALIEGQLIPDDVSVQVLTQSREHIIKKTFDALSGAKNAVVHLYNSTSVAQREQVFKKSKSEIIEIAVKGAKLIKQHAAQYDGNFRFEYSPESFTGTEPEFALEICNAVLEIWQPSADNRVNINLPVTVENSMPHVYASQVEYMCDNLYRREFVNVSLHPHNDRGCGVADTEMGLLAGADRVEGTLFGNGERTGNVDIITLAMNMFSQGTDPKLNLSDMPRICEFYESVTGLRVSERHPYCGSLVFAAFSGSHQDAIAKGMAHREENPDLPWTVPYLPIDPKDVGREYDGDVIRINSQSGKGGVSFVLRRSFGIEIPPAMRESVGYAVKDASDKLHKELTPDEVFDTFKSAFVNKTGLYRIIEIHYVQNGGGGFTATVTLLVHGTEHTVVGEGVGRLDAVSAAVRKAVTEQGLKKFNITHYSECAQNKGSDAKALSFIQITDGSGRTAWGAGLNTDIIESGTYALFSAVNNLLTL